MRSDHDVSATDHPLISGLGENRSVTILLLGDSNLARLCDDFPHLARQAFGDDVENRAAGGAWSGSLREQIGDRRLGAYEAIVVSIGSSDNHPSFASSPAIFRHNIARELRRGGRWIALLPRDLVRALDPSRTEEVNAQIRLYKDVLEKLIMSIGGVALDVGAITGGLGPEAYDADGMHLTRAAYELLVPEISAAIRAGGVPTRSAQRTPHDHG